MILYLDTSSLVKLYLEEEHAGAVHQWAAEAEILATSRVAYAESLAAVARRQREGDLSQGDLEQIKQALKKDWPLFAIIEVDEIVAGDLAIQHALRGFDAIHLAAALTLKKRAQNTLVAFSSFDLRLNQAAENEGFLVRTAKP